MIPMRPPHPLSRNVRLERLVGGGDKVSKVGRVVGHEVEDEAAHFGVHLGIAVDLEGYGAEEAIAVGGHGDYFEGAFLA